MEPWVVVVLAILGVLILGSFGAAFLPLWFNNRGRTLRRSGEETWEAKADRLHKMVHRGPDPDEQAAPKLGGSDAD